FPGPVQLSATGVPAGVTATFDPTTLDFHTGAPTQTSTLTLTATPNAQVAPATITVHARNGALDQTASVSVHGSCVSYDVQVNSIQVTQGVQTLNLRPRDPQNPSAPVDYRAAFNPTASQDTARLVRGGITVARVFASATLAPPGGVQAVDAELHAYRDDTGQELYGSPLKPMNGPRKLFTGDDLTADEANPDGAYTFTLPVEWTRVGSITLKAVLLPPSPQIGCRTELCRIDNTFTLGHVPFFETQQIAILPIAMTVQGAPPLPPPPSVFATALNVTPVDLLVAPDYAGFIDITDLKGIQDGDKQGAAVLARLDDFDCDNTVGSSVFHIGVNALNGRDFTHSHYVGNCQALEFIYWKTDATVDLGGPLLHVTHELFHVLGRPHAGNADACYSEPEQKGESWPPDGWGRLQSV